MRKNISKARAFAATNKASGRGPHRVSGTGKRRLVPSAGLACMLSMGALAPQSANAGFTITVEESGDDVVVSYSGFWETWNPASFANTSATNGTVAKSPLFLAYPASTQYEIVFTTVTLTEGKWTSTTYSNTTNMSGDIFGFRSNQLYAPQGYTANTELSGSFTFVNKSFDQIGFTDGDSGYFDAGTYGRINFTVGDAGATPGGGSVPEPSSLALLGCGAVMVGLKRWPLRNRGHHRTRA